MPSLTSFIRSLGNDRAVSNARFSIEVHVREDWLVAGLVRRIEAQDDALAARSAASDASSSVPHQQVRAA
jgi:hypothetical protein